MPLVALDLMAKLDLLVLLVRMVLQDLQALLDLVVPLV